MTFNPIYTLNYVFKRQFAKAVKHMDSLFLWLAVKKPSRVDPGLHLSPVHLL